jgi:hypothetical protein
MKVQHKSIIKMFVIIYSLPLPFVIILFLTGRLFDKNGHIEFSRGLHLVGFSYLVMTILFLFFLRKNWEILFQK